MTETNPIPLSERMAGIRESVDLSIYVDRAVPTGGKDELKLKGGARLVRCPFHNDSDPSLIVNNDGTWRCWSEACKKHGDVLDFIGYLQYGNGYTGKGVQLAHVIDLIAAQGITPLSDHERAERLRKQETQVEDRTAIRKRLWLSAYDSHTNLLNNPDRLNPLYEWGISQEVIESDKIGWDGTRYTFPAFYRGYVFCIKRRVPPRSPMEPKYNMAPGSKWGIVGSDIVLETPNIPLLVVVEDEKSRLALISRGIRCTISTTGGSGFWGSKVGKQWGKLLLGVDRFIFWRDADESGVEVYRDNKVYRKKDKVRLLSDPLTLYSCEKDGTVGINPLMGISTGDWLRRENAGLQAALAFRKLFPQTDIIGTDGYKDAGDLIGAGLDPLDVLKGSGAW
jgi:hypothetical protein